MNLHYSFLFYILKNYLFLFIWMHQGLVVAYKIFSCGMQGLVPQLGIEPGLHVLRAQNFSHTREVLILQFY